MSTSRDAFADGYRLHNHDPALPGRGTNDHPVIRVNPRQPAPTHRGDMSVAPGASPGILSVPPASAPPPLGEVG
jgi:hypothetical protein